MRHQFRQERCVNLLRKLKVSSFEQKSFSRGEDNNRISMDLENVSTF